MDLLNLCLTWTYFQYNGKHYKQLHGTSMGSPVSVIVAEIVMQKIEESALSTCRQTIPLWLRYVDDTFTAVRHDEIDAFYRHLNEQNTDIKFTYLPNLFLFQWQETKNVHGDTFQATVFISCISIGYMVSLSIGKMIGYLISLS